MSVAYFTFRILPALLAALYSLYLARIILDSTKLKAVLSKPDKYGMRRAYNQSYLIGWSLLTLSLVADVALDYYRVAHRFSFLAPIIIIGLGLIGLWQIRLGLKNIVRAK